MSGLDYINPYGINDPEPGAVSVTETNESSKAQAIHTMPIAVIGRSLFGKPQLDDGSGITSFDDPRIARRVLGVCPIVNLMEKMWDGSPDPNIREANIIDFIRLDVTANTPPTQAIYTLLNAAASVLTASSVEYGAEANKVMVRVVTAVSGMKDVYTSFKGGKPIAYMELGRALQIHYVGSGTPATMTITRNASDEAITLTTACTGATADNLSIVLADFPTISALASFIDALPNYTANVHISGDPNLPTKYLDPYGTESVTALDIKTALIEVDAKLGSIVHATRSDPYVIFQRVAAAKLAPDAIGWKNLSGGTGGISDTVSATTVQDALDYLANQNRMGGKLFIEDQTIAVQLIAQTWIDQQRQEGKRWRLWTAVNEGTVGDEATDDERITQLLQINHIHTSCTCIGIRGLDYLGQPVYSAMFHAAELCGMDAGSGLVVPLTRKAIKVLGTRENGVARKLDKTLRNRYILAGGITPYWQDRPGGGWQSNLVVTTSTATTNRMDKLVSERDFIDEVDNRLEARLEADFTGQWADANFQAKARIAANDELDFWAKEPNQRFVANPSDPNSRPYQIGTISTNAGITQVPWSGHIGGENDHIEILGQVDYQTIESVASANLQ